MSCLGSTPSDPGIGEYLPALTRNVCLRLYKSVKRTVLEYLDEWVDKYSGKS